MIRDHSHVAGSCREKAVKAMLFKHLCVQGVEVWPSLPIARQASRGEGVCGYTHALMVLLTATQSHIDNAWVINHNQQAFSCIPERYADRQLALCDVIQPELINHGITVIKGESSTV